MKTLKNPIKKDAKVNFMYGYPIITHPDQHIYGKEYDNFFKNNTAVAAMATGQGDEGLDEPEQGRAIFLNRHSDFFDEDPNSSWYKILAKLEGSRHLMHEMDYKPKFEITPELQALREKHFSNEDASRYYLNDDNLFRQTLISRMVGGEGAIGDDDIPVAPDFQKEIDFIDDKMNERHEIYGDGPSEEYLNPSHQEYTDESEPSAETQQEPTEQKLGSVRILKSFNSAHGAIRWMTFNRIENTFIESTSTLKSLGYNGSDLFKGEYHIVLKY
jgi:hypothetical protein